MIIGELVTRSHFLLGAVVDFAVFGVDVLVGHQRGIFGDVGDAGDTAGVVG